MATKRRKPVELLRVPFNCFIAPVTKESITGIQNQTRESQGEVVDRAVALLSVGGDSAAQPRKPNKREKAIRERAASDQTAQRVERDDIDYSDTDSTPTTHVALMGQGGERGLPIQTREAFNDWRAKRKPLLKPKDKD